MCGLILQVSGGAAHSGGLGSGDWSWTLRIGPSVGIVAFSQLPFFPIQVQLFPSAFFQVFCEDSAQLTSQAVSRFFTVNFSEDQERRNKEMPIITFWRHFLLECEGT